MIIIISFNKLFCISFLFYFDDFVELRRPVRPNMIMLL